ncbi:A24 family peptidase [Aurantiacibacter marinus]|uniref:Prepilin type IV endopeptidase peptidase domain-containing protein n=1 Tax=Aurantiacibacter marinus TaxID=874156 RepID=A0A0H0XQZ3_9SPHN|nr:prepilin peptidase [Aurantiacibacter marinus]KLI64406.1 hypothetical protein AAV99_01980 [Aurantiacibacter marinus]
MPEVIPFAALAVLAVAGAVTDVLTRRIPNWLNLVIFVGGIIVVGAAGAWSEIWPHLLHFVIALAAGLTLFGFGMWGGGDAKFYSALALWFPLGDGPMLALSIAVAGVAVLVLMLIWSRIRPRPDWSKELPYGAAIASGAVITTVLTTL